MNPRETEFRRFLSQKETPSPVLAVASRFLPSGEVSCHHDFGSTSIVYPSGNLAVHLLFHQEEGDEGYSLDIRGGNEKRFFSIEYEPRGPLCTAGILSLGKVSFGSGESPFSLDLSLEEGFLCKMAVFFDPAGLPQRILRETVSSGGGGHAAAIPLTFTPLADRSAAFVEWGNQRLFLSRLSLDPVRREATALSPQNWLRLFREVEKLSNFVSGPLSPLLKKLPTA